MKERCGEKIKLTSYEELLGASAEEGSVDIDILKIRDFEKHPFKVLDDEKMDELVKSIRENGVLSPILVRPVGLDEYEIISGHRRRHASAIAGLTKIPAIIRDMSDEEATIAMVDANIQREEILPSEKAYAYRMKMEAMKRQGCRSDLTSCQNDAKSDTELTSRQNGAKFRTDTLLSDAAGDSARQIQRYIRLTELTPELLEMVDNKKLKFVMAVELSYLDKRVQGWVLDYWKDSGTLQMKQVKHLRQYLAENKKISQYKLVDVLNDGKKEQKTMQAISIPADKVQSFFPPSFNAEQKEKLIIMLLEKWSAERGCV